MTQVAIPNQTNRASDFKSTLKIPAIEPTVIPKI
ncbi:hypothetical protein JOC47_001234 [Halanaerobacter jeridensis]|uniref:Uncharacterized protein n=1 Tax=Halanaerobacter jeridensis TaxID=706427 RepID=A0A938XU71_9FIRM|nr:hypothetical protein [Halanaerobacter jeridensis]